MTGTEIEKTTEDHVKSFQEKLIERVKSDIGELVPDEVLVSVISRAYERAFFEPRTVMVKKNYGGHEAKELEPMLVEVVREVAGDRVETVMREWLDEHAEDIDKLLKAELRQGMARGVYNAIENAMNGQGYKVVEEIRMNLRNAGLSV